MMPCCEQDCRTQQEMRERHGTPESFRAAIRVAYEDLFITLAEAQAAAQHYRDVYAAAPEGP